MESWFIFIIFVYLIAISLGIYIPLSRKAKIKEKISELANNILEVTPEEFFKIRNARIGKKIFQQIWAFLVSIYYIIVLKICIM